MWEIKIYISILKIRNPSHRNTLYFLKRNSVNTVTLFEIFANLFNVCLDRR